MDVEKVVGPGDVTEITPIKAESQREIARAVQMAEKMLEADRALGVSDGTYAEVVQAMRQMSAMIPRIADMIADGFQRLSRSWVYAFAKLRGLTRAANCVVFDALGVKPTRKRRKVKKYWKRYVEGR